MPKTVILSAARTPIGKLGGGLASVDATELGATAIRAALERADVDPGDVQHVVMGQVLQAGQGQIPSRQAQVKAGIPNEISSETINKVCASGIRAAGLLDAVDSRRRPRGRRRRRDGVDVECALPAQGRAVRLPDGRRQGDRRDDQRRPHEPVLGQAHGPGGERGRGRAGDDARRHGPLGAALARARVKATDEGRLPDEIVPVTIKGRKGDTVVEIDEAPRRDTSLETLSKLPPIFLKDGSHTAGNSPGVNDGGGALVRRPATSGRRPTASARWRRSSPRRRSPTTSRIWPARRPRPRRRRSTRSV